MLVRTRFALAALSTACFTSVTSENLPVALLPQLADGFGVSEPAIGLLVTGYAVVVAVTVVPLVTVTARWDRRTTALAAILAVTASNLLLAVAPGYAVAVIARLVAAVGHGVFWSVVAAMASRMLGPERAGRATAVVYAGNSVAFLLGLPLCSWLGTTLGWRATALVMAGVAALAAAVIRLTVDAMPAVPRTGGSPLRHALTDRSLVSVNLTTVLVVLGHFTAFTYITVIIADYVRLDGSAMLLAHGAAGVLGLVVIGRAVDRHPRTTALVVTGGLAACMLLLLTAGAVSTAVAAVAVVLWAIPAGGMAVVLQAAVLRAAAQPDLASAVYIVAFQAGIALGAWAGGVSLGGGALTIAAVCGLAAAVVVSRSAAFTGEEHHEQAVVAGRRRLPDLPAQLRRHRRRRHR
ncbi:MFS transporter [Amycolatopsis suaedae]|uniref:MFS transporter n=1 Tax=Amycolatopsis suaedae TaxID=2510978 RepID=A0A4Q7J7D1_9PSEU|nr:MFS transporter [Amycolatopsis suaedae]RZQ62828.1 MFS transporter [Amycolatopsis suaedae]